MRLFIGIQLDQGTKRYIQKRCEKMKPFLETGRFTSEDNFHLTLKFLGEARKDDILKICRQLDQLKHMKKQFDIHLDGLGVFPKKNKAILWIGLREHEALVQLDERIEELMEACGFERETRPYTPHITLGRGMRFKDSFEALQQAVHIKHECVHVHEVTLFESTRVAGKLAYVPLYTVQIDS